MRIDRSWGLPANPDTVYAMLTDPAFSERVGAATGAVECSAEVIPFEEGHEVVVRRSLPTDRVPGAMQRLVGSRLQVTETSRWSGPDADGARRAELDVDIDGAPVRYRGSIDLEPHAQGSSLTVEGDLKAGIPLIGGQIERAAAPALAGALEVEERESRAWLSPS